MKPPWMALAEQELGVKEVDGPGSNPRILEYHALTTLKATDDAVPWCSSFVNWCIYHAGLVGTRRANARSWLDWGAPLAVPLPGCIVIFKRGSSETAGHVAFYDSETSTLIRVLGGNQGDQVSYARYRREDLLGYRWPAEDGATA